MSIASEITRLSGVRSDIFTSITNKGVTVPATATFSSCPALIDSITGGGGGGEPTSLINSAFTASGKLSGYREFTATQNIQTISAFEDRDEVWSNPVTSRGDNKLLFPVYSADIKNFYESNSGNILSTKLNFDYTATTPAGHMQMYIYMVPRFDFSRETSNTVIGDDVYENNQPGTFEITFQMSRMYEVLVNNSAEWQWNVQDGKVYIGLEYMWFAEGFNGTAMNVSSLYQVVTGTSTAYVYPDYPTTTTGYVENVIDLKESWRNGNNQYKALLSAHNAKNVVYENSPSNTAITSNSTANTDTFSASMLKNKWSLNLDAVDDNYTYSYDTTNTGYSGFEGV